MATLDSLQFEMERRVILFKPTTSMPDDTSLGYNGDPNLAVPGNSGGEFLIYNSPNSTRYAQFDSNQDIEQEWFKSAQPNVWTPLGSSADASLGDIYDRLDVIDASIISLDDGKVSINGDIMTGDLITPGLIVNNDVSILRNLYVAGDTNIAGDLTIDGSLYVRNVESIDVSSAFIVLNTGQEGIPPASMQSGIVIDRGSEDPYVFLYDETDNTFRIGIAAPQAGPSFEDASTQAVATREDDPIIDGIAVWNEAFKRFDTSTSLIFNELGMTVDSSVKISSLSGTGYRYVTINPDGTLDASTLPAYVKEASIGDTLTWDSSGFLQVDTSAIGSGNYDTDLDPGLEMPEKVGGFPAGTTVADLQGDALISMWDNLLFPSVDPTYINPNNSFGGNNDTLEVIGNVVEIIFSSGFSRGEINVSGNFQDFRSGAPNSYFYTDASGNTLLTDVSIGLSSDTQVVDNYLIVQGNQTFTSRVGYDEGPQPYDNKGVPFESPLPAGSTTVKSVTFEGVYPIFASSVTIGVLTQQSLVSMISGNYIQLNLAAESGGQKQQIDIPETWELSRPLIGVQQYNTVSGQWEYPGGTATSSLTLWNASTTTQLVFGEVINYNRYTYNGTDRSSVQIRLVF